MGNKKAAVYMKEDDTLTTFMRCDKINLYQKSEGESWLLSKTIGLIKPFPVGIGPLRDYLKDLSLEMEDCGILAGGELGGIPYSVFTSLGFSVFDIDEFSIPLLDLMYEDVSNADESANGAGDSTAPVETSTPGIYFVDLVKIQKNDPTISTKKILQPFLNDTPFFELQIVCNHIPPWLENGAYKISKQEETGGVIRAVLSKKNC